MRGEPEPMVGGVESLSAFSPPTRAWFNAAFATPTPAQSQAWESIIAGRDTLVVAPTGSGKTLAAFLWAIDRCTTTPVDDSALRCRVLYISPLKALASDVERNLRSPLNGIRQAAARAGRDVAEIEVGIRTGDTSANERRRLAKHPPDILITTPESLFLLLTSKAREMLRGVDTIIVDEIHAVAGTKRGAHLALSIARLQEFIHRDYPDRPLQRIGLSATARPASTIAKFLNPTTDVAVVSPPSHKEWDLSVVVPVADMSDLGAPLDDLDGSAAGDPRRTSLWPHVEERLVDLISERRSTLVFTNSRRLAERLTARLNDIHIERTGSEDLLARAHHGSVSHEQRRLIEEELKAGRLPAVVATSSLELGIDMGAVDLVVQVETPPSVASGLQRVGRAGHQVGAISNGVFFPKFRSDLVHTAVVVERMREGAIESIDLPMNPLDVLAQHIVSAVAMDEWNESQLRDVVQESAPFTELSDGVWDALLDMLAGRYPGEEFAELRPRIVWDRVTGTLTARPGAQRLAVTSGGTIPDRGLYGVYLVGGTSRVGELDEEMVYESRVGDVFRLGATSWRIQEITHDRVWVSPAIGEVGRMPFWRGDRVGRPVELGRAIGEFLRGDPSLLGERLEQAGLDTFAVDNVRAYLDEQRQATGVLPDDRTVIVERFRDELGDWRIVVHTPFGARVHAPWALAIAARLRQEFDLEPQVMHADDGIVFRLPDTLDDAAPRAVADLLLIAPEDVESIVTSEIGGSALFAGRFRECAARALLLPRRNPGRRSPLWQQRQRSAHLLSVASRYPQFPIVLETVRECLRDVYDMPGLQDLLTSIADRRVSVVDVHTDRPSPFAQSLLFGYVAEFLYDGDAPLAERKAAALTLDSGLLSELLGQSQLRDLIDVDALATVIARISWRDRTLRDHEDVADLLRVIGPIDAPDAAARGIPVEWLNTLVVTRRAIVVRIASREHWAAVEDAARLRDALGVALPVGIPEAFLDGPGDPLTDLLSRYARTHGPFTVDEVAATFGCGPAVAQHGLDTLVRRGRVVEGGFRPMGNGREWCDAEVLRAIRRSTIAALRNDAEPVAPEVFARFLSVWQGVDQPRRGVDALYSAIGQLAGVPLPASQLETLILPARITNYTPAMLDELMLAGEVTWWGAGTTVNDGWLCVAPFESRPMLQVGSELPELGTLDNRLFTALQHGGASFFRPLADHVCAQGAVTDAEIVESLYRLVWAGLVSNDSLSPIRIRLSPRGPRSVKRRATGRALPRTPRGPRVGGPPAASGRWWALPIPEGNATDNTRRTINSCEVMLQRYGIVTRSIVASEGLPGGFAAAYRVLSALEESGSARRSYAVEGQGAAQFAIAGAVDRLRDIGRTTTLDHAPHTWAAADPAQPFGAALPWPDGANAMRAARSAGALVTTCHGRPVLYAERGLRTVRAWPGNEDCLSAAAGSLVTTMRKAGLPATITRLNGVTIADASASAHPANGLATTLHEAGFVLTPRGLALRVQS